MDNDRTFTEAFDAWGDELFRHAMMRLSDRERALEVTQECFLRAFQYARQGGEILQMRPFLYRTLRNLIIDEYRRHKPVSLESMAEAHEMDVELFLPSDDTNTLAAAVGRFEGARALKALEQLPDVYREALTLRYVEELSPREIAGIIGESENVVSVRVHRALKKLRELLDSFDKTQDKHDG